MKQITILFSFALLTSHTALGYCPSDSLPIDQSIVLTIDISNSIDGEETYTQMMGYKEALLDPEVQERILICGCTDVSVVLFGSNVHTLIKGRRLKDERDLVELSQFFNELGEPKVPLYLQYNDPGLTHISDGLSASLDILRDNKNTSAHKAILVSGDGKNSRIEPDRFAQLQQISLENLIEVSGVPIDVYDAYSDSEEDQSSERNQTTADGYVQEPDPEITTLPDFYSDQVINDLGFMKIAKSYKDLPPLLKQSLKEIACPLIN